MCSQYVEKLFDQNIIRWVRERDITKVCELLARARIRIGERMEYDVNGRHPVASELTLTLRSIYSASLSSRVYESSTFTPHFSVVPFISSLWNCIIPWFTIVRSIPILHFFFPFTTRIRINCSAINVHFWNIKN